MSKLSDTQRVILGGASQHEEGLATPPVSLSAAARNAVFRSMLNAGLLEEVPAPAERHDLGWRQEEDWWIALRITEAGRKAIGVEGDPLGLAGEGSRAAQVGNRQHDAAALARAGQEAPVDAAVPVQRRSTLREAVIALLEAWDAGLERPALPASIQALRAALGGHDGRRRAGSTSTGLRPPRDGTKQQAVLTLLRRPEGTTLAHVMGATGWA